MPSVNTNNKVKSTINLHQKVPDCLTAIDAVCAAGATCAEVQADPIATGALAVLQGSVKKTRDSLNKREQLATALIAAAKALGLDFTALLTASRTYESAVGAIAKGDPNIISKAGLKSRPGKVSSEPLGAVSVVHTKPWKRSAEALLTWPKAPGATSYAIEINTTPQAPTGPWTALISGTGRRRVVKAPVPGGQMLARVAALDGSGNPSAWSDQVLVTTSY